jgi:ribosomal protein S18 acetylase RimI-like enzyme
MTVFIRKADLTDLEVLQKLGVQTYRETFIEDFGIRYPASDERQFLESAYGRETLTNYLQDPDCQHFLAEMNGVAVGYALAARNTIQHPTATRDQGELKRLYVLRSCHRRGVGEKLFQAALAWLQTRYPGPVWLGVWEKNERAKAFYFKRGFEKAGEHVFRVGTIEETDWILRKS